MKKSDLLELFISGEIYHENVTKVTVDEDTDMKWLVGAVDATEVAHGTYLVYYEQIYAGYGNPVKPDYTLHDEDGTEIFMLRIEDTSPELTTEEAKAVKRCLHAVTHTFRRYPGMNTGSSQVHNLYWSDIELLLSIHDKFPVEL